jgi:hypothetical protein
VRDKVNRDGPRAPPEARRLTPGGLQLSTGRLDGPAVWWRHARRQSTGWLRDLRPRTQPSGTAQRPCGQRHIPQRHSRAPEGLNLARQGEALSLRGRPGRRAASSFPAAHEGRSGYVGLAVRLRLPPTRRKSRVPGFNDGDRVEGICGAHLRPRAGAASRVRGLPRVPAGGGERTAVGVHPGDRRRPRIGPAVAAIFLSNRYDAMLRSAWKE